MVQVKERWDRTCPACGTVFSSVQEWGVCPQCSHRFAVDLKGRIIATGGPADRVERNKLVIPENIEELIAGLPVVVRERVDAEFAPGERHAALQMLASYGEAAHENWGERVWLEILDSAQGYLKSVESMVLIAKTDHRDLFYSSSADPSYAMDRLLQNLRFHKVLSDSEVAEATKQGGLAGMATGNVFSAVCKLLAENKQISHDQYQRICRIGDLLRYPPGSLDWLKSHVSG